MMENDLFGAHQWLIGTYFNSTHPFFAINKATVIYTWVVLSIILVLVLIGRYFLMRNHGLARFMTLSFVQFFIDFANQSLPKFSFNHFAFIASMFCFILLCNIVSLIPWMEEPTVDLNTTLALGITAFLYTQAAQIRLFGIWEYIKSYFSPFFIMVPLNIVGKFATVISISFRLFGNIFGGSIINSIYFSAIKGHLLLELIGLLSGLNIVVFVFFNLFEGFLQAFVFAMLSLTYLSIALQGEGH